MSTQSLPMPPPSDGIEPTTLCMRMAGLQVPVFSLPHVLHARGVLKTFPNGKVGPTAKPPPPQPPACDWMEADGSLAPDFIGRSYAIATANIRSFWRLPAGLLARLGLDGFPPLPATGVYLACQRLHLTPDGKPCPMGSLRGCAGLRDLPPPAKPVLASERDPARRRYRLCLDIRATLAVLARRSGPNIYRDRPPNPSWGILLECPICIDDPAIAAWAFASGTPCDPTPRPAPNTP